MDKKYSNILFFVTDFQNSCNLVTPCKMYDSWVTFAGIPSPKHAWGIPPMGPPTETKLLGNERFRRDCEAVWILAAKIEKHKSLSNLDLPWNFFKKILDDFLVFRWYLEGR